MLPLSSRPTLFPYTTLFRSRADPLRAPRRAPGPARSVGADHPTAAGRASDGRVLSGRRSLGWRRDARLRLGAGGAWAGRSEEHTSELQSLRHLVCRLLLEKK